MLRIIVLLLLAQPALARHTLNNFLIEGSIHDIKDGTVVRLFDIDRQIVLDSAFAHNNSFTLKGHVDKPTTCWLQCMGEYAILQVENVNMQFDSPLKGMVSAYTASGGKEQDLQNALNGLQRPYDLAYLKAYDSLVHDLYKDDIEKKRLIKLFNENEDSSMMTYVKFGIQHINSSLGLDIVYRNRNKIAKDSLVHLYNSLSATYKNSSTGNALKGFLYETLAEKGKMMIDFDAKTITGNPFKLSSLKGKLIYLSFGSAGCGPCRMENKELAKNYNRLSKDIEMLYFSLDKNMALWKLVTMEDKIVWNNVSDMAGDDGRIKTIYDVQSIPTSFLIDRRGIIIERMVGYDDKKTLKFIEKIIQRNKE